MNGHSRLIIIASVFAVWLLINSSSPSVADELALIADAVPVPAVNIDPQLRAQFEPVVKVELSFAIRACKLEGEQRQKLIAAGEKWLVEFANDFQKQQLNRGPKRIAFRGGFQVQGGSDPRSRIAEGIAEVAKSVLTSDQFAVYERECEQRENAYREAIAATLVVRMDEKLALSAEQRQQLTDSFTSQWDAKWAPPIEIFMYNNDIWPPIPDKVVSPHLTPAQWEIWTRLAKNAQNIHFGGWGLGDNAQVIDDVDFEKPAEPVAQPIDGGFPAVPVADP